MTDDYFEGYCDGLKADNPEPNGNRSERYVHSFNVGRAELAKKPIPAAVSRKRVEEIEERAND